MSDLLHEVYIEQQNKTSEVLTDNSYKEFNHQWTGKVIDNADKLMLGRIKVRIIGFYDDISDSAIPWAMPESKYLGSSKGDLVVPEIGTIVRGYFDKGDDQKPIYTAVAPNINNYALTDALTHPDEALEYPNVMVLLNTDEGERLTLNRSTGEVKFVQRAGTTLIINADGSVKVEKSLPKTVGGSVNTTNDGLDVSILGKINITSELGGIDITSKYSTINVNASGGAINLGNNACDTVDENGNAIPSPTKRKVNNFSNCLFTNAPHCDPVALPNVNVYV